MKCITTEFKDLVIIENTIINDHRGAFIKTMNAVFFTANKLHFDFKETYFSISKKDVIRGMHFQIPPFDHAKLVYVLKGAIIDVVLDIRKNADTYGKYFTIELNDVNRKSIYIPKGFAHGFLALTDDTNVMYHQTSVYHQPADRGIQYNSFGMQWDRTNAIVSDRDKSFPNFEDFKTPF